jgi:RNA polymerase sigma-70 factor (ECF subfamily)
VIEEEAMQELSVEEARPCFTALVERHSQLVYRIALAVTRNRQDAEDVAQETFLQLFRGQRWERIEDERGYLARIAWRLAARRKKRPADEELPAQLHSLAESPETAAIDANLEAWMHSRIDQLPEKLRQPLALAALGELKLVEVAKMLGLPEGTVRRRIHTARQILTQQMELQRGGSHERRN